MALKPTIYKVSIALSDLDRNRFEQLDLTIAQLPSETVERMMVRVLAFAINADEGLMFTAGISTPNEPDIVKRSLDNRTLQWIDVGEPSAERVVKASRVSEGGVRIYSFNSKSDVWWQKEGNAIMREGVEVFQFDWSDIKQLSSLAARTMTMSLMITEQTAFVSAEAGEVEVPWRELAV